MPLPVVSHLNIYKLQEKNGEKIEYYFFLYSDYIDNIQGEDEVSEQSLDTDEADPFDPELISIDTKKLTMETVLRRLRQKTINLTPDFQRNEVWTIDKKCQLIESLMLKIPLPMFYVSADEKGNYTVVDGLQRLSTIRDYIIEKKFELKQLEFWGEHLEGFSFDELPTHLENRILETEFTFTVINPGTPDVVKRNIFKRVNRGGAPLTDQEIRHALYSGIATELLKELSTEEIFLKVTDYSIKSNRMLDREFILRLLAFTVNRYGNYPKNGNMDAFLSTSLQVINYKNSTNTKPPKGINTNILNVFNIDVLRKLFTVAMNRALDLFGEHAFRKSYNGRRRTPVNKALFEVWGNILSEISESEFKKLMRQRQLFLDEYIRNYLNNYGFDEIISRNALKYNSVIERHSKLSQLVSKYIK